MEFRVSYTDSFDADLWQTNEKLLLQLWGMWTKSKFLPLLSP